MPQFAALWQAIGVSSSIAIGAITGAVAGFVGSGNSSGLVAGAFAGAAFGTLGKWKAARPFARTAKSVAHAAVGGVQHLIQGGKFGHGFFSAGFTQALGGPIGRIDPWNPGVSPQRVIAAAVVGGTASRLTGGKFANGAITGAFSRALNDELHPFVRETVTSFQKQRFWREFGGLPLNKFRAIFPSIAAGNDDFLLQTIQSGLYDEYYRSGAYGELLSVGRSANDLLADYTIGRVAGIVGARGRLATILGKGAGLTGSEIKLLKDSFAIKAFADQQGLHMSQLSDLADILIQNNQTIDQAILELQE